VSKFVEQRRIYGVHGIDQRRYCWTRLRAEESIEGGACTCAIDDIAPHLGAVDESLATPFARDEALSVKAIENLGDCRVDEVARLSYALMNIACRGRPEPPESRKD
jgi:hypothetical protein